jgi:hypothetical protein
MKRGLTLLLAAALPIIGSNHSQAGFFYKPIRYDIIEGENTKENVIDTQTDFKKYYSSLMIFQSERGCNIPLKLEMGSFYFQPISPYKPNQSERENPLRGHGFEAGLRFRF